MNYKSEVFGDAGIVARCVAKSLSIESGIVITTLELEYPRFIHSELMTHRLFSRNAASSRAIPIQKTIEQVRLKPAMPVHWGKNQAGMQAKEELSDSVKQGVINHWRESALCASHYAQSMESLGTHKQVVNRILEPYVFMKTVVTATEWNNWDYLRYEDGADPTICELARVAKIARNVEAIELSKGDWHTPYYLNGFWKDSGYAAGQEMKPLFNKRDNTSTLENALAISSSCCAQVSFRSLDPSLEKAERVYDRLLNSKPVHASPFEHQATPIVSDLASNKHFHSFKPWKNVSWLVDSWEDGITHVDRKGNLWSGNFKGWIQHRQLIPDNVVEG